MGTLKDIDKTWNGLLDAMNSAQFNDVSQTLNEAK
jgi:hypothetical protein